MAPNTVLARKRPQRKRSQNRDLKELAGIDKASIFGSVHKDRTKIKKIEAEVLNFVLWSE